MNPSPLNLNIKLFMRVFSSFVLPSLFCFQALGQSQADITIQSVRERLRKLKAQQDENQSGRTTVDAITSAEETGVTQSSAEESEVEKPSPAVSSDRPSDALSDTLPDTPPIISAPRVKPGRSAGTEVSAEPLSGPTIESPNQNLKLETVESRDSEHFFGDWHGRRRKLEARGLDLNVVYKGEGNRNLSGGLRQRTVYLGSLDVKLSLDGEKAWKRKGLSVYVNGMADHGADNDNSPSKNVGDIQGTSNIERTVNSVKLYEASVQQNFKEDRISFLFGLHALGSEFYMTDASTQFLNKSFGVGRELSQTGVNGPSLAPTTALALRAKLALSGRFDFLIAAFGAQSGDPAHPSASVIRGQPSDGLLWIGELMAKDSIEIQGIRAGKISLGVWQYSRTFDHLSDTTIDSTGATVPTRAGNSGFYGLWNQSLNKQRSFFLRAGWASAAVNQTQSTLAFGMVKRGPHKGRPKDSVGFGLTRASLGAPAQDVRARTGLGTSATEVTTELYYRFEVKPGLAIQPDLQWVDHPSQNPPTDNAMVASIRAEINF